MRRFTCWLGLTLATCGSCVAQTANVAPPALPTNPNDCLAKLSGLGAALRAVELTSDELLDFQARGSKIADLCMQSKFKEVVELEVQLLADLAEKPKSE